MLDKLICFAESQEITQKEWHAPALLENEATTFGCIPEIVTKKAFRMLREQYDLACRLTCEIVSETANGKTYIVTSSKLSVPPYRVSEVENGILNCECNLLTYKGIVCCHCISVRIASGTCLSDKDVNTRWLRSAMQSAHMLAHESPFASDIRHLSDCDITPEPSVTGSTDVPQPLATTTAEPIMHCEDGVSETCDGETGVQSEPPVYRLDGGNVGIHLSPKEVQNEVRGVMNATLAKIGLTYTSVPKLRELQEMLVRWTENNVGGEHDKPDISVQREPVSLGARRLLRIKAGKRRMRHNGKMSKVPYRCSICGKVGHNRSKCKAKKTMIRRMNKRKQT